MITHANTYEVSAIFDKKMLKHSTPTIDIYDDTPTVRTVKRLRVYHGGNAVLGVVTLGEFNAVKNTWDKELSSTSRLLEYPEAKEMAKSMLAEIENSTAVLDEGLSNFRSAYYYAPPIN